MIEQIMHPKNLAVMEINFTNHSFCEDIYKAGKDIIKENVFLISDANPPIPIILINTTKRRS